MATQLPARLKALDISRFAMRAAQLEKLKPSVAYWCYYHIANKVLSSGLHNADEECKTYLAMLLDKLENMKNQYASDATIHDDQAARHATAEFGLATFERADKARRAYAATRQTADTYLAACTFLELLKIWDTEEDSEEDVAGKIKAAKYHALRIANALKSGKDPNERPPEPQEPVLSEDDPEVQAINAAAARQPTVEELPDEDAYYHSQSPQPETIPHFQDVPGQDLAPYDNYPEEQKLDPEPRLPSLQPSPVSPGENPRKESVGGGYFPEVAPGNQHAGAPAPPLAPPPAAVSPASPRPPHPTQQPSMAPVPDVNEYYQTPPRQPAAGPPHAAPAPYVTSPRTQHYQPPTAQVPQRSYVPPPQAAPAAVPYAAVSGQTYRSDDASVAAAQKHAKWAISALNFDDPNTAVKELRLALNSLGAQ